MSEGLDSFVYGLEEVGLVDAKMNIDGHLEQFIDMSNDMRAMANRQPLDKPMDHFTFDDRATRSDGRRFVP